MDASLLWDFDETVAHRPEHWSGVMVDVLDRTTPGLARATHLLAAC